MKNVVIFFLFLCVHLFSGYNFAHASAHNTKVYVLQGAAVKKTHQFETTTKKPYFISTNNAGVSTENAFQFTLEDEDENEDIIKKHVSQSRYFLAFCYAFILNSCFTLLAERLPSCNHLSYISSCKYITQRALLI